LNNPLIANTNLVRFSAFQVRNRYESRQQINLLIDNGKITLVTSQRGNNDFFG
jgi:hypothetical protein